MKTGNFELRANANDIGINVGKTAKRAVSGTYIDLESGTYHRVILQPAES